MRLLRWSLSRSRGVLRLDALLLLVFAVSAASGLLRPLERAFSSVMAAAPLPPAYFLAVTVLGALLPLAARLKPSRSPAVRAVLDPFLALLGGQLVSEVLVVVLGGKGLAVLVGLVFSLVRLLQIRQLWTMTASLGWLRRLLLLQALVWGSNAVQIGVNRIGPLLG
ncbi:MAG: hypothetical protein VKI81_00460 [Synechococcaceae cyanobacterium]|nr:hypothetical protein [Synechococcaceae cyanobacterium]